MMNKLINPILFIMCLLAMACSDDNNENETFAPFSLEKRYYEVRLERNATSIPIINGSGDISLVIEDENILNAIYSKYNDKEDDRKGHINLYGMQKGSTTLTITDNITKDVETVEVKVTDCYLAYVIADSNHPALKANTVLFFVNNPEKECYVFTEDNIHGKLYEQPIAKGNYEFFVTPSDNATSQFYVIPCLHLNITDNDATTASYDFQIKPTSEYVLNTIQAYLGVEWGKLSDEVQAKSPAPIDISMTLIIPDTDYQIIGVLSNAPIPEDILD
jgi:hypothetical protein